MATVDLQNWIKEICPERGGLDERFNIDDEKFDEIVEVIQEQFLDEVFDVNSKIARNDFISSVSQKQNYLFNAKEIRKVFL